MTARRTGGLVACAVAVAAAIVAAPQPAAAALDPPCPPLARFSPLDFPERPTVGSRLLPLEPGAQRVLQGKSNVSGQTAPHTVTFTVTDLTKVINGVRTVLVHDVDVSDGRVAEEELAFFAQDRFGNVWNLGEYPEELPAGVLIGAPSTWMAGSDGATGGIHMPALLPEVDSPPYLQGYVPRIDFLDCATTFRLGATTCVPAGCFDGTVITEETSPLDPGGGSQLKTYAPGVGVVDIGFIDDPQAEQLVLAEYSQLDESELAKVREAALILDRRGMATNPFYAKHPPAELPLGQDGPAPVAAPAPIEVRPAQGPSRRRLAPGRVRLSLVPGRRATRGGRVPLRVLCRSRESVGFRLGACRGRLELSLRGAGERAGAARFDVPGGSERTVRVQLRGRALRLMRAGRRLTLDARTRGARAGTRPVVVRTALTLAPPR